MSDTQEKSRPWKSTRYKKQSKHIFCSVFSVISPFFHNVFHFYRSSSNSFSSRPVNRTRQLTGRAVPTWRHCRGSTGSLSQIQRCWRNGSVFRRRPRIETIARLAKWVTALTTFISKPTRWHWLATARLILIHLYGWRSELFCMWVCCGFTDVAKLKQQCVSSQRWRTCATSHLVRYFDKVFIVHNALSLFFLSCLRAWFSHHWHGSFFSSFLNPLLLICTSWGRCFISNEHMKHSGSHLMPQLAVSTR